MKSRFATSACLNLRRLRGRCVKNRSGIEEGQKQMQIPDDVWADNWDNIFKREKKNAPVMRHKKKKRNDGEDNDT